MLKGLFLNVGGRGQDWREMKNVYTFGACGKRGQGGWDGRKGGARMGKTIIRKQGGGRKKLISMKIIG